MKHTKLFKTICLFLLAGISTSAFAVAETEPNDTWNQANVITLGATGTGTTGTGFNEDWWRVTSANDGELSIAYTATSGLYVYCQIYDTLGVLQLASNYTLSNNTVSYNGITAGTYYIKFVSYYTTQACGYSFVPTWNTPAQANDVEPNGTRNQAKVLGVNNFKTGHIGYYHNNLKDTLDWYKVTTAQDGLIKWTITSHNGKNVWAELFDNNGTTVFGGAWTTTSATFSQDGLSAGTYYIRIKTYYDSEYSPYTISDSLILPPVANDAEPNGTFAQALPFNLNDTVRGHIGYYYNNLDDTLDWYKVTTTFEGRLDFTIFSLNNKNVWLELVDGNGSSVLAGSWTTTSATYSKDGLAVGTYYFRLRSYYVATEFSPYKFIVSLTTPAQTIDAEPNGTPAQAITINKNDSVAGHIGYYYNALRDSFDWRKVVLTNNGKLEWTITSANGQNVYAKLYDNNGTTDLGGNYTTTTATYSNDGLAPGTYYLLVRNYYQYEYAPYTLKTKFTAVAEDPEPNGTYALAKTLALNSTLNGNFGYYYNGVRDTNDWLKLTTTNDGQLSISYTSVNGDFLRMIVYDNNGTTELYNDYTSGATTKTFTRNDLGKGTYYVRLKGYYTDDYTPYTLVNSLTTQLTNDVEYNGKASNAIHVGGYKNKTGHINYYYNNQKDTADWYKVKLVLAGNLQVKIDKSLHTFDANYPDLIYKIYSDTTLAPFATNNLIGATPSYTFNHNGIAAGTYWIKLERSVATFGAYKITTNYKDTASATIALTASNAGATAGSCSSGSATYFVTRGIPPYSVQLFLDGVATGAPVVTNDTAKFTLLAPGAYYATVKCTGAVTSVTTSTTKGLVAKPKGNTSSNITGTTAWVKWAAFTCVDGFIVSYKKTADPTFVSDTIGAGITKDTLKNLSLSTSYDYKVAAFTVYNNVKYISLFTAVKTFTTLAAKLEGNGVDESVANQLDVYPNPVSNELNFELNNISETITVSVLNALGQTIKTIQMDELSGNLISVDVSDLQTGVYLIQVKTNNQQLTSRFIKE